MKKHIYLDRAGKGKLRQIFDCTGVMIWKALTFESDSEMAREIRYTAIKELGGFTINDGFAMDWETTHQTAEHTMTQTFGKRVKIISHNDFPLVVAFINGKEVKRVESSLMISDFMNLQDEVVRMAYGPRI